MSLLDALLSAAEAAGNVVDTPGAAVRSALVGENPLDAIFDTKKRKSGRELLEHYGLVRPNEDGLDAGDIAGFLAEGVLDPLNLLGGGIAAKLGGKMLKAKKLNKAIKASNQVAQEANLVRDAARAKLAEALSENARRSRAARSHGAADIIDIPTSTVAERNAASKAQREMGFMPEEVARETKITEGGKPKRMLHGTSQAFDKYDISKADPGALYGKGIYTSDSPAVTGGTVEDVSKQLDFPTREAAENHPRRNYFVWKEGDKYRTTVSEPQFKEHGYASKGGDIPVDKRAEFVSKLLERNQHIQPSYLTKNEYERLMNDLGNFRVGKLPIDSLAGSISGQPYNMQGVRELMMEGGHVSPNIRMQFIDARKPLDLTRDWSADEANSLISGLGIRDVHVKRPVEGDFLEPFVSPGYGDKSIRDLGYDAIVHTGGKRIGDVPHKVVIAFDPSQIYKPYIAPELIHNLPRSHSLVPAGHPETVFEHVKSFASPPNTTYRPLKAGEQGMTQHDLFVGLKKYQPLEALVPEHRRRLAAALAALAAHNAGRSMHSPYGED
ncbi:MAG: hypothetical protein KGL39_28050 [Patescibacteria group bacterium]|nr:hypothetical protein [Patescibacteria group bacterium]